MEILINLIKDPKNKVIAVLGVLLITSFIFNLRSKQEAVEVKQEAVEVAVEEIVEDDHKDEIDFTRASKDIESNQKQIIALWKAIGSVEKDLERHEEKKKH